jgi:hypothetical protein
MLANLSLLTDPALSALDIRLDDGVEEVFFCRASAPNGGQAKVRGRSGDTVSLIPWNGPVEGVTTEACSGLCTLKRCTPINRVASAT